MRRYQLRRATVALVLAMLPAGAAWSQEAPPEGAPADDTTTTTSLVEGAPVDDTTTTSSTTTTTSTTVPPTTTTTTAPPPFVDPSVPLDDPDEAGAEVPPTDPVVVPPREVPRLPTLQDTLTSQLVTSTLSTASFDLVEATQLATAAAQRAVQTEADLARMQLRLDELRRGKQLAQLVLEQKQDAVKRRAVLAYTSGGVNRLNTLLDVRNLNELNRRRGFIAALNAQDRAVLEDYTTVRDAATTDLGDEERELEAARVLAEDARRLAAMAGDIQARRQGQVDALRYGGTIVADGFAFPVGDPHVFADTFGAPRMSGTAYEHRHQGTDIFAPMGTPLRAMERSVVIRMGTDMLGGTKLWLVGATGTRYYYAHLSGYAPGIVDGVVVEAGAEIGYVGRTGNARTTPPHLHIEVHPDGGPAINPFPLLKAVDDATRAARAAVTP